MKRALFGGLILLVAGLLLVVIRGIGSRPEPTGDRGSAAVSSDQETSAWSPRGETAARPPEPIRVRHTPTEEEVGHDGMNLLLGEKLPLLVMQTTAEECFREDLSNRHDTIEVAYTAVLEKGQGRLTDVAIVEDSTGDRALGYCIVKVLSEHRWTDHAMPNFVEANTLTIGLNQLHKLHREATEDPFKTAENVVQPYDHLR